MVKVLATFPVEFYLQPTVKAARNMLGALLIFESPEGLASGRIVETEAYLHDDPACHSYSKKSDRNCAMWGPPGTAYVYKIYGIHHCINAVTQIEGFPEAVLIRALEPLEGIELMQCRRPVEKKVARLCSGPGNLCQALGINLQQNGLPLTKLPLIIVEGSPVKEEDIITTTRVGITKAADKLWRFYDKTSRSVSRK